MANASDRLADEFANPPATARPRVWWHWMNGNVTAEGVRLDIEWMKRIGIGGLQNFDAALATPLIVNKRLAYMTPEWRQVFRQSVEQADKSGLEFGIASSPGWSETGGPWVPPEDGIKKFVWSETFVRSDQHRAIALAAPPSITGPFQSVAKKTDPIAAHRDEPTPSFFRDTVVLAYPDTAEELPLIERAAPQGTVALERGNDGSFEIAHGDATSAVFVEYRFARAAAIRAVTLAFDSGGTLFTPPRLKARLEASLDGKTFSPVAEFPAGPTPQYSISFPEQHVRAMRIVFTPQPPQGLPFTPAPGALKLGVGDFAGSDKGPIRVEGVSFNAEDRVHRWEEKAGFEAPFDYYALDTYATARASVAASAVLDLTDRLRVDGTLDWTPPTGHWRVLRFGYSLTGKENHPATAEATGLEVDKYDGDAVARYVEHYLSTYDQAVGTSQIGKSGIRAFLNDSIEVGAANWTPRLLDEFKARRGYEARIWMPALTGVVVESAEKSDQFLYDFRRTLADLIAEKHYATVARIAQARGLRTFGEALEFGRPSLGDDMDMRRYTNVPMSAMWTYPKGDAGPRPVFLADMRGAASVAHIYGQNIVAAESLTSAWAPWAFAPKDLKPMIDQEFAAGINLPVIHTSVHQPVTSKAPGLSLAIFGQNFNRLDTWAEAAKPWVDYIARSAYLLQQGRSVADVLYFYGEEAPLTGLYNGGLPKDAPTTSEYDFANAGVLLNQTAVKNGEIVTPSGQRYKLLWLGGSAARMTPAVARRIAELARQGAHVGGLHPNRNPSLNGTQDIAAILSSISWVKGNTAEEALRSLGVTSDFVNHGSNANTDLLWKHRMLPDGRHIYFVANRRDRSELVRARFRADGLSPSRWNAETGERSALIGHTQGETTEVELALGADDAAFVVFDKRGVATPQYVEASSLPLNDGWTATFPGSEPKPTSLGNWESIPEHRYFAGTAIYRRTLQLPKSTASRFRLELGDVGDVAEVFVDGRSAGIAWRKPYGVLLPASLRSGGPHILEVRVTNLWVNRLIGDAQPGATRVAFTALPTYAASAPLRRSGLFGPVTLKVETRK